MANRVLPTLRLAVLCEDVEFDGDGRPALLAFPVHTVQFPPGVKEHYRPPTPKLYLQLQAGVGTFFIWTALREEGEVIDIYRMPTPTEIVFNDDTHRVLPLELVLEMNELIFPRPGMYELLVFANYVSLHGPNERIPLAFPPIRVTVLPANSSEGGAL